MCLYYLGKKKQLKSDASSTHLHLNPGRGRWWSPITWPSTCPQTKTNKLICHTNCLRFIKKQNCISRCWQLRPSLHGRRGHSLTCLCMLGGPSWRFPLGARESEQPDDTGGNFKVLFAFNVKFRSWTVLCLKNLVKQEKFIYLFFFQFGKILWVSKVVILREKDWGLFKEEVLKSMWNFYSFN